MHQNNRRHLLLFYRGPDDEAGTNPPSYSFTGTESNGQITVKLSDGTTDTITINGDEITFSRASS